MLPGDLPELVIVRVLTAGGPYRVGDALSVAFVTPTIGRLVAHAPADVARICGSLASIPEIISVCVTHAAPPYARDAVLTLSFVDPGVARIHPAVQKISDTVDVPDARHARGSELHEGSAVTPELRGWSASAARQSNFDRSGDVSPAEPAKNGNGLAVPYLADAENSVAAFSAAHDIVGGCAPTPIATTVEPAANQPSEAASCERNAISENSTNRHTPDAAASADRMASESADYGAGNDGRGQRANAQVALAGVRVRLHWNPDRVRRFVQVVDKLFTVDRLGWHRHAFAMRLLVPDEITCGDAVSDAEATRHLVALRAAAVETLGRPMLAAFMPNFTVTPEWLDSLDSPAAARALAGLREAIVVHVVDGVVPSLPVDAFVTTGVVERRELLRQPGSIIESVLPILVADRAADPLLCQRLRDYRRTLIDVFGQTAKSPEAVRINQMAQPNHALDDRLWQLVGVVGQSLGNLVVA